MVDKGFIQMKSDVEKKNANLYCPPFMSSKGQFSKSEIEFTDVLHVGINVERKMEQIKNFRILQGVITISDIVDSIFFVCSTFTNLLPMLVKD